MGTGGWDPPRRTEIVHESERARVTRLFYPDRTLIRKEPLGPDAERRLEHETAMLARVRGVAGLAQLAEAPWDPGSVLLTDAGQVNLAAAVRPLAAADLARVALRLARAVANMHDRQVMHRDITPANIVLSAGGDPCLVDFALATSFADIGRALRPGGATAAAMAYLAPELTGRTGRTADQRADLYSLGATLYQLATGAPPFGSAPPPGVPASLSTMIMHLLEKDPGNRYQSAGGLVYDLERLWEQQAWDQRADPPAAERAYPTLRLDDISAETSIERLQARVIEVLAAMTGATGVRLVLWDEERRDWLRTRDSDDDVGGGAGDQGAGAHGTGDQGAGAQGAGARALPLSVLRYLSRTREPLAVADATTDDRFARDPYFDGARCCSLLATPILGHGSLQAALLLENRLIRGAFTAARLEAAELIAGQLAVSLRNVRLYTENRRIADQQATASKARIVAAADQARRRIERDLHDGAQQRLVSLSLQLRRAQAAVPPGLGELSAELERAVTAANSALDEVGEIARGIHPAILTSGGLLPAVRALAHRSPVPVRVEECTGRRLPEQIEVTAYYVIAEALTNATKHARASAVSIRAEVAGNVLLVTIGDDGVGGASRDRGTGLTGLEDRVEALGGVLRIESPPGTGTTLRVRLPLNDRYAQ